MMIRWETRGREQKLASVRPVTIRVRRGALRWVLACAAMLTAPAIFALGVGDISWQSKLNEPLDATIELIYSDTTEPSSATVRLASEADFSRVGMDRSRVRSDLTFVVERNDDGNFVIRASSESAITEPFVNFLIEVEWANGRLLREYVVLLDPPVTAPSAVEVAPLRDTAPDPVVRQPVEDTAPESDPGRLSPADTAPTTRPSFSSGTDEYGPVSRGETLWEIAREHRPDTSVSINQMMVAMLRMNPDAFYQDNVNALREGAVLRIPTRQQVDALSEAQANNEVLEFNESWNEYARVARLAQVPTVSDVGADAEFTTTSPSTSTGDTTSRLELVPPSSTSQSSSDRPGSDAQAAALRNDLSRTREDLISAQQENNELNDRVDELENLVSHLEKMVSLKDTDLAKLQEQLRQARELEASAGIDTTPSVDTSSDPFTPDTTTSDPIASDTTSGADADPFALPATTDTTTDTSSAIDSDPLGTDSTLPSTTDTAADSTTTSAVADTTSAEPVTTAASTTTSDSLPSRPPEGKPWYDGLVKNKIALGGLVGLLLALVGLVVYAKKRRASEFAEDEVFELVDSADIDESQVPDLSSELGEDEDRETVLREALATDPDDPQNHLALIRRHYAADDRERFVAAAEAMRDRVGDSHPAWMEVRAMGANIASDHAIFGGAAEVDENAATRMMNQTGEEDLDLRLQLNTTADDLDLDLNLDDDTDTDLDLDLGDTDSEMSLDLDLGDDELDLDLDSDDDDLSLDLDSGGDDLDLDLDLDDVSGDAVSERASGDELSLDLDDDFDLDLDHVSEDATSISSNDLDLDFSLEDSSVADDGAGAEGDDDLGLDLDLDDLGSDDSDDFSLDLDDLDGAGGDGADLDLGDLDLGDDDAESEGDLDLGDLDLDLGDDDAAAPLETDFQIEALDADELADNAAKETRQLSLEDDLGLGDLDLGGDLDDDDDAAGTKLDLAKAYIDMGDPDGARGMLDEVLAEGTESQQSEARSLLDSL